MGAFGAARRDDEWYRRRVDGVETRVPTRGRSARSDLWTSEVARTSVASRSMAKIKWKWINHGGLCYTKRATGAACDAREATF